MVPMGTQFPANFTRFILYSRCCNLPGLTPFWVSFLIPYYGHTRSLLASFSCPKFTAFLSITISTDKSILRYLINGVVFNVTNITSSIGRL